MPGVTPRMRLISGSSLASAASHVVVDRGGAPGAGRRQAGRVGREGIAAAAEIGLLDAVAALDHDGARIQMVGAQKIGQVELRGRAGLDADGRAGELAPGLEAEL